MPVILERPHFPTRVGVVPHRERRLRKGTIHDRGGRLNLGLVNNMPDSAVCGTERQFVGLLEAAAGEIEIRLRLYSLERVPRSLAARHAMAETYAPAAKLRTMGAHGIIVTGSEPRADDLAEEPYWDELTRLTDWAEAATISSIFSCLAAHAAVQHRSGVRRRPLPTKCSGVFPLQTIGANALTAGLKSGGFAPHSRWNALDENELTAAGYVLLTRAEGAGVDAFAESEAARLVFFQGHPEYEPDTLAKEFRRDMLRWLTRERSVPPDVPVGYFSEAASRDVAAFHSAALAHRGGYDAMNLPERALRSVAATAWRATGATIVRNWLTMIVARNVEATTMHFRRYGG